MKFKGKIVFLSGAITGVEGYKKIFAAAEERLETQGCIVLYITKAMVHEADIIYVLKNWEYSKGVWEELSLAACLDKEIIYES